MVKLYKLVITVVLSCAVLETLLVCYHTELMGEASAGVPWAWYKTYCDDARTNVHVCTHTQLQVMWEGLNVSIED